MVIVTKNSRCSNKNARVMLEHHDEPIISKNMLKKEKLLGCV